MEILFSPGATATPLHIDEANRDSDVTRLDTAPLDYIGRDGLTCREVEDIFGSAIMEGGKGELDLVDVASASTVELRKRPEATGKSKQAKSDKNSTHKSQFVEGVKEDEELTAVNSKDALSTSLLTDNEAIPETQPAPCPPAIIACSIMPEPDQELISDGESHVKLNQTIDSVKVEEEKEEKGKDESTNEKQGDNKSRDLPTGKNDPLSYKYYWTTVAMGTLLLGAGCIVMAMSLGGSRHARRRYTRR